MVKITIQKTEELIIKFFNSDPEFSYLVRCFGNEDNALLVARSSFSSER